MSQSSAHNAFGGLSNGLDASKIHKERQEQMCNKWKTENYQLFKNCYINVAQNSLNSVKIVGYLTGQLSLYANMQSKLYLNYIAPGKANSGQVALPFPNESVAYSGTRNYGAIPVSGNKFTFFLNELPNSYYKNMGTELINPEVRFYFSNEKGKRLSKLFVIKIANNVPYRTLTYDSRRNWNDGPLFYHNPDLTVRTQEQILRDSCYSAAIKHKSFWGMKPPV
jgi:hypothetical protein